MEAPRQPHSDEYWKQKGIEFCEITLDDYDEVIVFLRKNFFTDETLFKHSGLNRDNGEYLAGYFKKKFEDWMVSDPLSHRNPRPTCIAARKNGKLVATRLGLIKNIDILKQNESWSLDWLWGYLSSLPKFFPVPEKIVMASNVGGLLADLHYDPASIFKDLQFPDKIYFACNLTVDRECRGMGLGEELVLRSVQRSKEDGCNFTHVLVTSIYSQKIFAKAGFKTMYELPYKDYEYDSKGRLFMGDTGIHEVIRAIYYHCKWGNDLILTFEYDWTLKASINWY